MTDQDYDVAIIGGGPAGSTLGTLLRKYDPELRVLILEREKFPREHVGESQLPPIGAVLEEMGCWDKVEAANFPIKVGATYRWGKKADLWDFEFLAEGQFQDEPRPAKYEGQRVQTAFQVERAIYDDILLRHAEEVGVEVREETAVVRVHSEGDRVTALELKDGSRVTAKHYVDASGHSGLLRRSMGIDVTVPTSLKNIALYDYWENAEWAVEIGVGGTRVQVMSQSAGWLWFIPLGPTRTSIGFVCPAEYYKSVDETPEELYQRVIQADERIAPLVEKATCRGKLESVTDWSFLSQRNAGENWFLAGEAAGFADPVLAAGLTLTHTGARDLAYVILELERGELEARWLKQSYDEIQRQRIHQHIRFADFWYASNGQFTDLQENCAEIAREAGLRLTPAAAWTWLAQGGFTHDVVGQVGIGGLDISALKQITQLFSQQKAHWNLNDYNVFRLRTQGAKESFLPNFKEGRVEKVPCFVRGDRRLPMTGMFKIVVDQLRLTPDIVGFRAGLQAALSTQLPPAHAKVAFDHAIQALEVMISEGWVDAKLKKNKQKFGVESPTDGGLIHPNREGGGDAG